MDNATSVANRRLPEKVELAEESRPGALGRTRIGPHEVLDKCCVVHKAESGPSDSPFDERFG